jgi:hemerythrin-like domain-containing protein
MAAQVWITTDDLLLREARTARALQDQIMPGTLESSEVNDLLVRLKTGTDHVHHSKEAEVRPGEQ